jgi:cell division protein FtsL
MKKNIMQALIIICITLLVVCFMIARFKLEQNIKTLHENVEQLGIKVEQLSDEVTELTNTWLEIQSVDEYQK